MCEFRFLFLCDRVNIVSAFSDGLSPADSYNNNDNDNGDDEDDDDNNNFNNNLKGSNDSDYSFQSSEFSIDDDPEVIRKEMEANRKEVEKLAEQQLEKSRV